jgi:hypothetical protein
VRAERGITKKVRYKSSKKGRRRKVIRVGKADVSFTGKDVTSHGGMALVAQAIESFGVRQALQTFSTRFSPGNIHGTAHLLEQVIALRIIGGEALSDTQILDETALCALFGWQGVAHPTTFSRRLEGFGYQSNLALQKLVTHLSNLTATDGPRLISIDSTVSTAHGFSMEGARIGYNPHKPGRPSYHPLLAVDVNKRSVVDGYLRPGDAASGNGLVGFIGKIMAETTSKPGELIFRLDKGLTSGAALDTIEEAGASYVAKAKLTRPLMAKISSIKKWRSIGGGVFAANIRYQPQGWKQARRFCVIELNTEPKKPDPQMELFDCEIMEGRYQVVVTNLKLKAENVWRLYNKGAVVEQVIEELKNDFAALNIRTKHFFANDALFITGLIAYNLINCIKRLALPKPYKTARLKRIALLFLNLGANVVKHGRRLCIKIARDYPYRLIFYRAMAAMAAA